MNPTAQQTSRINDILFHIHRDISADLTAKTLCARATWSEPHFHRVFKRVTGETVHGYIRRTRLEQAANQLTFDGDRAVIDIAQLCGFNSLSSFTRAFKQYFGVTPGKWRRRAPANPAPAWQSDREIAGAYRRISKRELPWPEITQLAAQPAAYVRHTGYGRDIAEAWQILAAWCDREGRPFDPQIGLHHSNPEWVPLRQCRYVACVGIDRPVMRRGRVNGLVIPGGLHAVFRLQGRYGELLPWISKILSQWLPQSGLKMRTTPAFAVYNRNQFIDPGERFDLEFCLPVTLY